MTREQTINILYGIRADNLNLDDAYTKDKYEALGMAIKALEQEPCDDVISRKSIKQKLQEHHDFFVNAYGGFSNLPLNDKSRVDEITNCIAMVVNEPPVTPQEPQTFKWCTDCKEYDQEKHCCHRWSKVIRNTVEEMKQEYIEREVLDKIRAEIEKLQPNLRPEQMTDYDYAMVDVVNDIMAIIDKYKAKTVVEDGDALPNDERSKTCTKCVSFSNTCRICRNRDMYKEQEDGKID